jgi:hypothetical protein
MKTVDCAVYSVITSAVYAKAMMDGETMGGQAESKEAV